MTTHDNKNKLFQAGRVMLIVAHPDDPEFGAGGTTARWTQAGTQVTYIIVTDGSKGTKDPQLTPEVLVKTRQAEQRAAAQILGVSEVVFLGYPDGDVFNTRALRADLVRQIRLHRPDLVVTHDPTSRFFNNSRINHPDHRAVGDTALDAIFPLARDRHNFPEHGEDGLAPHYVYDVLLMGSNEPDTWIDIEETLELKIAALRQHRSQIGDPEDLAERIRQRAGDYAEGTPYRYAERFRHLALRR